MWWKTTGHRELYKLLMLWWDPIGVKDIPEAQREYEGYAGRLGRMLREDADPEAIAAFLGDAETGMGLQPRQERNELVAAKLRSWYNEEMRTT
jgi:hypothetical protein